MMTLVLSIQVGAESAYATQRTLISTSFMPCTPFSQRSRAKRTPLKATRWYYSMTQIAIGGLSGLSKMAVLVNTSPGNLIFLLTYLGYLPAEHIETPTERLARLNKHRNIDVRISANNFQYTDRTLASANYVR